MMHPELFDVTYRQRERELEQQREFRRVALERAATDSGHGRARAVWPALRSWWSARAWSKPTVPQPAACCAGAAA
ncbi:hypothetical protein GCM10009809_37490 [Isoptericola hypogeus]|uniref:Uncharacterized protein n=1 Tax=Isoptericola hypogeus TaxID=300179 RepID=A0ABN2JU77_9MICO